MAVQGTFPIGVAATGARRRGRDGAAALPQRLAWPAAVLVIGTLSAGMWIGLGWAAVTLL